MTLQEEAKQALKKAGSQRNAAALLGVSKTTFRRRLVGETKTSTEHPKATIPAKAPATGKKTLADFRKEYDKDFIVPEKIKKALKDLGPDGWEYESVFCKGAGISLSDLAAYREGFSEYVVHLRRDSKRAWAGSKKTAAQMREMV